jgi:hypothetical protein
MRNLHLAAAAAALLFASSTGMAATITGEYLEARTCDVYTGPCFANAEMDLAGKEALMAWKVDEGSWKGVSLDGLGAALVVNAERTLGNDGIFKMKAGAIRSVVLVDERATKQQRKALVAFVKEMAPDLTKRIVRVAEVPFKLENNYIDGKGVFAAGDVAKIETRALEGGDCVCTNEEIYYQPLTSVDYFSPAYTLTQSYRGEGLGNRWTTNDTRSAFLATFRR